MRAGRTTDGLRWAAVGAVALGLRLVHLWQLRDAPVFGHLMCDGAAYDAWARDVAAGAWLGRDVFYQAPLYPYFLATLYATVGRDLAVVRVVQAVLGATSCVLLGVAGTRVFGRRVGLAAGALLAVWPSAIFADSLVQKSTLDVFFMCAFLAAVARAHDDVERPARWLAPGITLGALALTRENALVFVPLLAAGVALERRARWPRAVAWLCAGVALVLAPVAVRNRVVGGEFHVTTAQLGPNLFIGNNELATGTYRPLRYGRSDPRFERRDATELAEQAVGRPLGPGEVSDYWVGRAVDFVRREPGRWLRLLGRKAALFVNRVELGDAEDQYTYAEWSSLLAVATPVLSFGLLVPLAAAGIVLTWRRGVVRLLVALLALYALTVVATFVMARYRHPALPLLLLFAAAAASEARRASARRLALAAGLAVAVAIPANWRMVSPSSVRAAGAYNVGRVLQDDADGLDAAASWYRRAVAADPTYAPAWGNLGVVLERLGRLDEARDVLRHALELVPDRPEHAFNLAHVEAARGDVAGATALYERVLAVDPQSADAHVNLGVLLQQRGLLDDAVRHYDAALAIDPGQPDALNDRGIALAQQGRLDDAVVSFRAALVADPTNASAGRNLAIALADAGRRDEALAQLDEIVARAGTDADARTAADELRRRLGAP